MKNFKGEKKVEEKQENLLQNTMQGKSKVLRKPDLA